MIFTKSPRRIFFPLPFFFFWGGGVLMFFSPFVQNAEPARTKLLQLLVDSGYSHVRGNDAKLSEMEIAVIVNEMYNCAMK